MVHHILLVEDDEDGREALTMLLQTLGHTVDCATTSMEAVEKARATRFDVVLLDLTLPDVSGLEVARVLRTESDDRPYLIAFTGHCQPTDRAEATAAGCDDFILKPAIEEVMRLLADPRTGRRRNDQVA
jgi:CheY-like chemotaxis protein